MHIIMWVIVYVGVQKCVKLRSHAPNECVRSIKYLIHEGEFCYVTVAPEMTRNRIKGKKKCKKYI